MKSFSVIFCFGVLLFLAVIMPTAMTGTSTSDSFKSQSIPEYQLLSDFDGGLTHAIILEEVLKCRHEFVQRKFPIPCENIFSAVIMLLMLCLAVKPVYTYSCPPVISMLFKRSLSGRAPPVF